MLLVLLLALAIGYGCYAMFKTPAELEGINAVPLIDFLLSCLRRDPADVLDERVIRPAMGKEGVARLWMRGGWNLIVANPVLVREMLSNHKTFSRHPEGGDPYFFQLLVVKLIGESCLFNSDGEEWRRHRRVANAAFKKQWPPEAFGGSVRELLAVLEAQGPVPVDARDYFQRLTIDILGKSIFSYDFRAVLQPNENHILQIFNRLSPELLRPLFFVLPVLEKLLPSRLADHRLKDEFRAFFARVIQERKEMLARGEPAEDLLSEMVREAMREEGSLSDEEVINDVAFLFIAGHDTTANTFTAAAYFFAKHPEIQERARNEVLGLVGEAGVVCPSNMALQAMHFVECVLKEAMRICTVVTKTLRHCRKDFVCSNGLVVPKGTGIFIDLWGLHHDPTIFPLPDAFDPDRFYDPESLQSKAWQGFSTGGRSCAASNFAMKEMKVTIAMLLQKFTLTLGPEVAALPKPRVSSAFVVSYEDVDIVFTPRA